MLLRDLIKMNSYNDGTRSLYESVAVPEVIEALKDWIRNNVPNAVLIGGLAVSYYGRPRATMDVDVLFLDKADIPNQVLGFKRTRPGAFQHNKTHVEVEVLSPQSINLPHTIAEKIFATANNIDGMLVASPSGLVVLKLLRLKRYDEGDIATLIETGKVDLTGWDLTPAQLTMFNNIVERNK